MAVLTLIIFKNPFSFSGRIRRSDYIISLVIYIILLSFLSSYQDFLLKSVIELNIDWSFYYLSILLHIPLLWFLAAQNTKRCHDRENNGFYQFIPFYTLWLIFGEGENGNNQYGEDPWNDAINAYIQRHSFYNQYDENLRIKTQNISKIDINKSNLNDNSSNIIQKIKKIKFIDKIKYFNLSSDEIIVVSVVIGVFIATLCGYAFGETIYYYNNGLRENIKNHDYSEFHFSYITSIASFITITGLSYILLNRKNKEEL